jgi:hypothetical protein
VIRRSSPVPWLISIAVHAAIAVVVLHTERPRIDRTDRPIEIALITAPVTESPRASASSSGAPEAGAVPVRKRRAPSVKAHGESIEAPAASGDAPEIGPSAPIDPRRGTVLRSKEDAVDPLAIQLEPSAPSIAPPAPSAVKPKLDLVQKGGTYEHKERGFIATIENDGTVSFDDRSNVHLGGENSRGKAAFGFDFTEAVMSASGEDPFTYEKMRFLEDTRELRAEMCDRHRTEEIQRSIFGLKGRLQKLWADRRASSLERRRLLFELWDECGEDEADRAGAMARATILSFIREHLPSGSPDAYPPDELLALNDRRASRVLFRPYD